MTAHKLTERQFSVLTILSEKWLNESLNKKELADEADYNLAQVFRVFTQ